MGTVPDDAFGTSTDVPPPKGREAPPLTQSERFRYLLHNPDLFAAARILSTGQRVGRPAHYPPFICLIFRCSISLFGSARSAAAHLQQEEWWAPVRQAVRAHLGDETADALKSVGPSRSNWNYFFQRRLKPDYDTVRDISRDLWIQQALDHGMMTETGNRVSRVRPERHQVIHGDATVAPPRPLLPTPSTRPSTR